VANGALKIGTGLNYAPQVGDNYAVLSFSSLPGSFVEVSGLDQGGGFFFEPAFDSTSLVLTGQNNVPPFITLQPRPQVVVPGENASFQIGVSGPGPFQLSMVLFRHGHGRENADTLALANIELADAGDYRATAQNAFGVVTSAVASLRVILPPSISQQPVGISRSPGTSASFSVTADGTGPLRYQWRRNGANIPNATNSSYVINPVQVADGGNYNCYCCKRSCRGQQ
jgi:hypothetical protein